MEFNPGITAVVGPNGCGKSNIVDALRWAMGEQSARHLRGHQMEDVVFAGSDSLPATGMAEVSITFDNEDGRSPAEYSNFSEIMVTRRLFRSGESEYAINKINCRLKDVIELFLGHRCRQQGLLYRRAGQSRRAGQCQTGRTARPDRRSGRHEQVQEPQEWSPRRNSSAPSKTSCASVTSSARSNGRSAPWSCRPRRPSVTAPSEPNCAKKISPSPSCSATLYMARSPNRNSGSPASKTAWPNILPRLHGKEAENESVRLSLLEADKAIGAQQENVFQRRTQIQTDEQKCEFYRRDLEQLEQAENEAGIALTTV